ncbi:MAG: hypothetical protein PUB21_11585 [Bacteroidales bacterium]|nr:hypothetical protein [Bacteroidales bacterium]
MTADNYAERQSEQRMRDHETLRIAKEMEERFRNRIRAVTLKDGKTRVYTTMEPEQRAELYDSIPLWGMAEERP